MAHGVVQCPLTGGAVIAVKTQSTVGGLLAAVWSQGTTTSLLQFVALWSPVYS